MALVRDTTGRFAALIGATAAVRDLDPSLVEKNYWAVEALRAVPGGFDVTVGEEMLHIQPIFKGGTARLFEPISSVSLEDSSAGTSSLPRW